MVRAAREEQFRIIGKSPDGSLVIIDGRGFKRRTRLVRCPECETEFPEPQVIALDALCWQCRVSAAQEDRRLEKEARSIASFNEAYARRQRAIKAASPAWRDRAKIQEIYDEARRLTEETGIRHEVDHHYPLQGELCCGLHVHANLRILPITQNRSKSNSHPMEDSPATMMMVKQYGMTGLSTWIRWANT